MSAKCVENMKNGCRSTFILMWKDIRMRWARLIETVSEMILYPIFSLLVWGFIIKNMVVFNMDLKLPPASNVSTELNDTINTTTSINDLPRPDLVYYVPVTPFTDRLMQRVGKELNILNVSAQEGIYGIQDPKSEKLWSGLRNNFFLVEFHGIHGWERPENLNYTIRMKEGEDEPVSKSFARLQWTIDTSFISILTNTEGLQNLNPQDSKPVAIVELQELPPTNLKIKLKIALLMFAMVCIPGSLMCSFPKFTERIVIEHENGLQELMMQAGVTYSQLLCSYILDVVLFGILFSIAGTIMVNLEIGGGRMVENSNHILIFLSFVLTYHATMSYAFVMIFAIPSAQYAAIISIILFVMLHILRGILISSRIRNATVLLYLSGLFPFQPDIWFWTKVTLLEMKGHGATLENIAESTNSHPSILLAYIFQILHIIISFLIGVFLHSLFPYGIGKGLNDLFKKKKETVPISEMGETDEARRDPKYFEAPENKPVGIDIRNVTKVYGGSFALRDVSFPIYRGEITVLLGHNAAGKTTLMSIITGTVPPTQGQVFVNGVNIYTNKSKVNKTIGLCPQRNVFFPALNVRDHVKFFAMLRGVPFKEATAEAERILKILGINDKSSEQPAHLSGGMKRRLQMACAVAGDVTVLILDEPTAGLDVETRREIWDMLLSLRGGRTVLLSTHFMEEADALGDRAVALKNGAVVCDATVIHLKRSSGSGFRLQLLTAHLPQADRISSVIQSVIPSATVHSSSLNSITYDLPAKETQNFPEMFNRLEQDEKSLEIQAIGIGIASLEEVFLQLCSNTITNFDKQNVDTTAPEPSHTKLKGYPLYLRQMKQLLLRQALFKWHYKFSVLLMEILLALGLIMVVIAIYDDTEEASKIAKSMDLGMYEGRPVDVFYEGQIPYSNWRRFIAGHVNFRKTNNITRSLLQFIKPKEIIDEFNKNVFGIKLQGRYAKLSYFKGTDWYTVPLGLNFLSNMIAQKHLRSNTFITGYRRSLGEYYYALREKKPRLIMPKSFTHIIIIMAVTTFMIILAMTNSINILAKEHETGVRHVHIMSGCTHAVHWLSKLVFDYGFYTTFLLIPACLAFYLDTNKTFNNNAFIGSLVMIFMAGALAILPFLYSLSFLTRKKGLLIFLISITAVVPAQSYAYFLTINQEPSPIYLSIYITLCSFWNPIYVTSVAAGKTANAARLNALCNNNLHLCPELNDTVHSIEVNRQLYTLFDGKKCCEEGKGPRSIFYIAKHGVIQDLILLFILFIVYCICTLANEYGMFQLLCHKMNSRGYKPSENRYSDPHVQHEKYYVDSKITQTTDQLAGSTDCILAHNLHKRYISCSGIFDAVHGINFSVKKGECFGLLGVNGAGKSTAFKMIVAEIINTRGRIYCSGHFLKWPQNIAYLKTLGYCPQFMGIDQFMTGRQNLTLLLTLRGLNKEDVEKETINWIELSGLEEHQDKTVSMYSGGCARRLAAVATLSSGAPVSLLDEPTAGVDVAARRRVWLALKRGLRSNRSIIITSHSMDEMEALCDRIAIMAAGEICALGPAIVLRAEYATGHALQIKLRGDVPEPDVENLKTMIADQFTCTLQHQHSTMLYYHISQEIRYSVLFEKLESVKKSFEHVIEDYSVTSTTLEDVFLSFAQKTNP